MHTRLTAFLFRIARDNVTLGVLEEQARVVLDAHTPSDKLVWNDEGHGATAKHLGAWAEHMARRLVPDADEVVEWRDADEIRHFVNLVGEILAQPYVQQTEPGPDDDLEPEARYQQRLAEVREANRLSLNGQQLRRLDAIESHYNSLRK